MALRDDEHVRGCLRIDVLESKDVFVLIYLFRRNLAADDTAEEGIRVARHDCTCAKTIAKAPGLCQPGESCIPSKATQSRRTRKTAPSGVVVSAASFWARSWLSSRT